MSIMLSLIGCPISGGSFFRNREWEEETVTEPGRGERRWGRRRRCAEHRISIDAKHRISIDGGGGIKRVEVRV
jgi:hypothetical protein